MLFFHKVGNQLSRNPGMQSYRLQKAASAAALLLQCCLLRLKACKPSEAPAERVPKEQMGLYANGYSSQLTKKKPQVHLNSELLCKLAATYSSTWLGSTIGAVGLSFSGRYG